VADGRSSVSAGLTLNELASYLQKLGAVQAVNFDGGGSSEMVLDGRIMNRPSDGAERPVSIALGIFPK
jgi:exopolysaccharide biosynthesis protein